MQDPADFSSSSKSELFPQPKNKSDGINTDSVKNQIQGFFMRMVI